MIVYRTLVVCPVDRPWGAELHIKGTPATLSYRIVHLEVRGLRKKSFLNEPYYSLTV